MEEIDSIKPLENINIAEVCRACFETCEQYKILFDEAESIDKRTLGDVFFDVVKIEMKANAETPPSRICLACSNDLISAYNFIQKSQKNNGRLLQYLENANIKKTDCLTEFPMDIPNDHNATDFLQIKVENEAINDYDYNESIPDDDRPDIINDSDESDYEPLVNKKEKIKRSKLQCIYCNRIFKRQDFYENHMRKHKEDDVKKKEIVESEDGEKLESEDNTTSKKLKKKSLKSRSQRSSISTRSKKKKQKTKSGRFECDYCNKTFAWKKDLFRHEKTHEPNTKKFQCPHCERRFIRKDKLQSHVMVHLGGIVKSRCSKAILLFSRQLYSAEKFKEMVCMICNYDKSVNMKELRQHISLHSQSPGEDLANSECVKRFFPDKNLDEVKALIALQIEEKRFGKLHSIVNANGLEMGISDSDESDEETLYTCEICSESFNRKHKLLSHSFCGHTADECSYKCDKCKLEFTCKEVFDSHLKQHCSNLEKEFHCENCPARFAWPQNLAKHKCKNKENTSLKGGNNTCEACGEVFTTLKEFRIHKKTKCGSVDLIKENTTCEICGKVCNFPRDLRKHKKIHIPDGKSHDCSVCGERFLRSENLRNHLKSHTIKVERALLAKKLICMLCGDKFTTIASLRYHLFNHSDGHTDVKFENSGFVLNFYPGVGKDVISEYIRNCFNEQKLSQLFLAVNKIGLEMTLSDSDSEDDEHTYKDPDASSKSYVCELCNVKFPRRQTILLHQYKEHSNEKKYPHKCVKCQDQFVSVALLERHFKSECQNDVRNNPCVRCGIKFVWKENLLAHSCFREEEKSPEDNKQCEVCGKKFIWLKDLHRHKRSHIPYEKKFECLVCAKKFNRKDNMRAHMKVHTAENQIKDKSKSSIKWEQQDENLCKPNGHKVIQCKICLSKHNTIKDLRTHLSSHKDPATFKQREAEAREMSMMIYGKQMEMQTLERAICKDLEKNTHTRFYSITNESGYELNLNDSETCSDFDADDDYDDDDDDNDEKKSKEVKGYNCKMCSQNFNRKFKIFEHQRTAHPWEELPYECNRCGAKFVCERIYQLHLQNDCENNEKQFKCKICPMKFAWKENLKNHEKYMHDQNPAMPKKHHCYTCGKSFLWVKDLARHQKTHQTEDEKFECTWCFRIFMRRDNLKVHMKVHQNATHILLPDIYYLARPNGTKVAQCKLCDQKYTNISDLAEHIRNEHLKLQILSITPNPASYSITNALGYEMDINDSETEREGEDDKYVCELCDARYNRRFKLLQHQQSLHYSDHIPHKCIECSFKCVSELVLNYHMRTQCMNLAKEFRCSKCTMRFMWKENLENHESLIHDGKRKHTCTVCKKDFATQHDLRNHTDCKAPADEKLFKCDLCDRKYNRKDRLMKHAKVHTAGFKEPKAKRIKAETAADKKFLCAFCGKEVSSSSNLVIHMRRHTGEKPFKCEFCNKGFPRSSDLACHRRTHTGERPHKCTVCEKAFSRSYKLQTHMRIHSGERPYKCTYCEKSFTQSNDLTLHVRRHTGERPYVCETCGERFIQGTALKNHRRMRGHYEI